MNDTPTPKPWIKHPFSEDDPACVKCGCYLGLNEGCEWGDGDFVLCAACGSETVFELSADLATALRERDEARALLADYEPLMSKGAEAMSVVRWLAICLKLNGPNWSEEPGFATTLTAPLLRLTAERDAALAQLAEWKRVEESVRAFAEHMGWNEAEPFVGSGPIEQRLSTALLTSIQQTSALAEARDGHRKQTENYIRLCDAVMGDGAHTSDFHDPVEIAKATRTELAEARKDSERLDWLEKNHIEFAEELNRIGWRSPCDAQWDYLKFFLRRIRCAVDAAIDAAKEQP